MTYLVWLLRLAVAFFCFSGAIWRIKNFDTAAKDVASVGALSRGTWTAIGVFEIVFGLMLVVPTGWLGITSLVGLAATGLAIEMGLLTLLHVRHFGFSPKATNPGTWTFVLCLLSVVILVAH